MFTYNLPYIIISTLKRLLFLKSQLATCDGPFAPPQNGRIIPHWSMKFTCIPLQLQVFEIKQVLFPVKFRGYPIIVHCSYLLIHMTV